MINKIFAYRYSLLISLIICILSFLPSNDFKKVPSFEHQDKLIHVIMYWSLGMLLLFEQKRKIQQTKIWILTLPILLGGSIEWFQPIVESSRSRSWEDLIANLIGVIFAWIVYSYYTRKTTIK